MKTYKLKDNPISENGGFVCGFFEKFPLTEDDHLSWGDNPDVMYVCHMVGSESEKYTDICKGDYCKCPLAYGKSKITPIEQVRKTVVDDAIEKYKESFLADLYTDNAYRNAKEFEDDLDNMLKERKK